VQVEQAILIFEEAYPNCIGVFLFNYLSTHTSLGPDLLYASKINKLNRGKQRKQKDTIISMNNPDVECCGKPQKITTKASEPKGL
jgi:hypothetical protein